jgi:hypothetical protein
LLPETAHVLLPNTVRHHPEMGCLGPSSFSTCLSPLLPLCYSLPPRFHDFLCCFFGRWTADSTTHLLAEFRGPGVHHNFDDSDSGYDMDDGQKSKNFGIGGYRGRIIFLGDGTEVLTDSEDAEMFDNADEDKDLVSQVNNPSASSKESESDEDNGKGDKPAVPAKPEEKSEKPEAETKPAAASEPEPTKSATKESSKKD